MILSSIPVNAFEIGIGFDEYAEIALNIRRMKLLSPEQRWEILERADRELPKAVSHIAMKIMKGLFYDREVFKIAGISYGKEPPEGNIIIKMALADYLLRNQN